MVGTLPVVGGGLRSGSSEVSTNTSGSLTMGVEADYNVRNLEVLLQTGAEIAFNDKGEMLILIQGGYRSTREEGIAAGTVGVKVSHEQELDQAFALYLALEAGISIGIDRESGPTQAGLGRELGGEIRFRKNWGNIGLEASVVVEDQEFKKQDGELVHNIHGEGKASVILAF